MQKQIVHLKADALLKFFLESDDSIDTMIKCQGSQMNIVTSDQDLYEALGCLQPYDNFKMNKLIKLLEVATVTPSSKTGSEKKVLTHEKVERLRKLALST
ncbi:MAG: hypothetical protein GY861_29000 [bacterium]|nr:hypothetical protein [bacterium]